MFLSIIKHRGNSERINIGVGSFLKIEIRLEFYYEVDRLAHVVGPATSHEGNLLTCPGLIYTLTSLGDNTTAIAT
jgi:hypothetical protein